MSKELETIARAGTEILYTPKGAQPMRGYVLGKTGLGRVTIAREVGRWNGKDDEWIIDHVWPSDIKAAPQQPPAGQVTADMTDEEYRKMLAQLRTGPITLAPRTNEDAGGWIPVSMLPPEGSRCVIRRLYKGGGEMYAEAHGMPPELEMDTFAKGKFTYFGVRVHSYIVLPENTLIPIDEAPSPFRRSSPPTK